MRRAAVAVANERAIISTTYRARGSLACNAYRHVSGCPFGEYYGESFVRYAAGAELIFFLSQERAEIAAALRRYSYATTRTRFLFERVFFSENVTLFVGVKIYCVARLSRGTFREAYSLRQVYHDFHRRDD